MRLIAVITQSEDPALAGTQYTLVLPNGATQVITENGDLYPELSHIIDHAFDQCGCHAKK